MPTVAALRGTRVLVTGASGFLGSHLMRHLVQEGAEVHGLSRNQSVFPERISDVRDTVSMHRADICDHAELHDVMERTRPSVIFHLAASAHGGRSWQHVEEAVRVNVQGTVNLLATLDDTDLDRFVYCGTGEVYGAVPVPFREDGPLRPASPYAVSKYAAERYCQILGEAHGRPVVGARLFNAYGPAQTTDRLIPEIIVKALRNEEIRMTSGRQTRDFTYVEDLVEGLVRLATAEDVTGEIVNLGSGEETSLHDVATSILELMGHPVAARFGALPDRPVEVQRMRCDPAKARSLLDWAPKVPLREGLERTIAWYTEHLEGPLLSTQT